MSNNKFYHWFQTLALCLIPLVALSYVFAYYYQNTNNQSYYYSLMIILVFINAENIFKNKPLTSKFLTLLARFDCLIFITLSLISIILIIIK